MAIVIEDLRTIERIERLAAGLKVSPIFIVDAAIQEKCRSLEEQLEVNPETFKRRRKAIREVQDWFSTHGDKDPRNADEIIGYNEIGLPA